MKIPKQVIIEVSSACQLKCVGCPNNLTENHRFMDFDFFKSIIDRVDFDTTIIPWMNGEPLLHPQYADMIKYITAKGLRCYITTNGMIWNKELYEHILGDTSCYQIIFSLDGLPYKRSRSIELARPGTIRDKVMENILAFGLDKAQTGAKIQMAVKLCQRGQDWGEVEEYIYYWLSRPYIDYVVYGRMLGEETPGQRLYPCQYFDRNFLIIRADGSSRICAYNDRIVNGNENPVGQIDKNTNLLEFYNNERFEFYRNEQDHGRFHGPCQTCGYAYTGRGFKGEITFRDDRFSDLGPIHYRHDYYNEFFSLKRSEKPDSYYEQ